jgi:hypothetical protein
VRAAALYIDPWRSYLLFRRESVASVARPEDQAVKGISASRVFPQYAAILQGLARLPGETAIDGGGSRSDEFGRPSFNLLQNYG